MNTQMDTILTMGLEARLTATRFERDEFANLLSKYARLRESGDFMDEALECLDQQIRLSTKDYTHAEARTLILEMLQRLHDGLCKDATDEVV